MVANPTGGGKRSRRQTKRVYHTLLLLGVGCFFTLFVTLVQPFSSINHWLSDQLFIPESPSPNIVIAGIDDATLETYGRWAEWPRSLHVQAINNLSEAGAKVIGFDVLFADSSPDDQTLAAAMESANNVVLALVGTERLPAAQSEITYAHFLFPIAPLEQASINIGHANIVPDPDGTVRTLPLVVKDSAEQSYAALSLAMLHALFSLPLPQEYPLENGAVYLLARDIPVNASYCLRINFAPEDEDRPYVSYGDVMSGDFDPSVVKNKIVLIGMTATATDTWSVPTSATKASGVFIHAAAMDTILTQRYLIETGTGAAVITLLLFVGVTAFALPRLGLRWAGVVTAGLLVGYLVASFLAFDRGYILNILYPVIILPLSYSTSLVYRILDEQRNRRRMENVFGRYVSPQVAQEIMRLDDTGALLLGGESRRVTVLFCDARGYTALSEREKPEQVIALINRYFSVIIPCILHNQGMINKFAGDNIMAVWSAPPDQPNHTLLSTKAALEAQQAIRELQEQYPDLPKMEFGMGINTGEAVAGNVGSVGRTEYTVIGDAVNVASRLCAAAPGGKIWLGPETYDEAKAYVEVIELEPQYFKGKERGIKVYEAVALKQGQVGSH
jgi:adenylate cyclase